MTWNTCKGSSWGNNPNSTIFVCCHDADNIHKVPPGLPEVQAKQFGTKINPAEEFECPHGMRHRLRKMTATSYDSEHWVEDRNA